ncbi:glycoside hydrolase family 88 protein [Paenibacillus whitsoniae]|uniref:Uncharacterized protein n=1 Tax=Paenibacillus whitsoniae TaxID=2496558 RepID=A0A3S0A5U2_9BACL|nr:hypothetical protein EJQ19_09010 [Paenibacillus whitsoniae]
MDEYASESGTPSSEGAGGPDDYKNQIWIDTLIMAGIFMLRFALYDHNEACIEKALKQFISISRANSIFVRPLLPWLTLSG